MLEIGTHVIKIQIRTNANETTSICEKKTWNAHLGAVSASAGEFLATLTSY